MSNSSTSSSTDEMSYYCHKCNHFVGHLYAGNKCYVCRTEFIEEVNLNDTQFLQNLLSIEPNSPRSERDINQAYYDLFEESSDSDEEEETPSPSSLPVFEWGIERNRSDDSLVGYVRTNILSQSLGIPSTTFSLLAEEFGFNPENIVINAGDILSRILEQIMGSGSQPMVPSDIERIPLAVISEEQVSDAQQCTVCMEFFKVEEEVRKLVCDHYFHKECIKPWLTLHSNCPVCRQDLNEN